MNNVVGSFAPSSLVLRDAQNTFDMGKDADVLSLLKLVHQNTLDAEVKNHIRDLVFSYRQNPSDAALFELQELFSPWDVVLTANANVVQQTKTTIGQEHVDVTHVGIVRPTPSFKTASVVTKTPQEVVTPTLQESIAAQGIASAPAALVATPFVQKEQVTRAPIVSIPSYIPEETHAETESQKVIVEPVVEVVPLEKQLPEQVTQAASFAAQEAVVSVAPAGNLEKVQERIKEIKHLVNEKVGNPVNLIDQNNEVGREYMNALLDAMKKSNAGTAEEVSLAMDRLEKAFAAVEGITGVQTPIEAPSVAIAQEVPSNVSAPVVGYGAQSIQQSVADVPTTEMSFIEPTLPTPAAMDPIVSESSHADANPVRITIAHENIFEEQLDTQSVGFAAQNANTQAQNGFVTEVPASPVAASPLMQSVGKEKMLQDLLRANKEKELIEAEQKDSALPLDGDPLMSQEVTAGLSQLLSEWSLFKSSGIFGTGPSGKDHVLYIKLAPLTMSAVVAGRFEGATPKIKQSISDYMNGWRYEEGVVHEHGETFEHYLRKVIYHILSKRK